jgi:glycosyltransferase involved in cell wall biosynthesis
MMKILFVCSGDDEGNPKSVVKNQGESLIQAGAELEYFCVKGGGIINYLSSIPHLRRKVSFFGPDIVHAHYSFSGFMATLAFARPLVVSLMGSDTRQNILINIITRIFSKLIWDVTIVKSQEMKLRYLLPGSDVLPNGVDTDLFKPLDKEKTRQDIGINGNSINILFVGNPSRREKNFLLAESVLRRLPENRYKLIPVFDKPAAEMPIWYNSADLLLLTSLSEGSPNAVKEAMACNLPVVATDVGDVRLLLQGVKNCFITGFDAGEISGCIMKITQSGERSDGREKIKKMGLDAVSVARQLLAIYLKTIRER